MAKTKYEIHKKWRINNPETRLEGKKKNYKKSRSDCFNTNKRWSFEEDQLILNSKINDYDLHVLIGRSVQSIQVRRSKFKTGII